MSGFRIVDAADFVLVKEIFDRRVMIYELKPVRWQRELLIGSPVGRPSIFARTGSKSTNHDLNIALAISSSVSFIF